MRIDVIRYEPHTLSLRPFKFFPNSFNDFYSCEVVLSSDMRKNETWSFDRFASIMAGVLKLKIYFMKVVTKCLHFVMMFYMKENKTRKQTLESAHYSFKLIFTLPCVKLTQSWLKVDVNVAMYITTDHIVRQTIILCFY